MQTKMLFSQYYLETRLPQHVEWDADPTPVYEALRALWEKAQQFGATWSEAQTEDEFIKPALAVLGWTFTVQPKSKAAGRVTRPDYALFTDAATQQAAYPFQGDDDAFYSRALAIAEAKYWGRPLSQKDASGRETWKPGENPSHQMVSYLVGTRVPWGILTNGRIWRLYSREVSSTASEFYEVGLAGIFGNRESGTGDLGLGSGDSSTQSLIPDYQSPITSFKRFWLFFRRDAFIPDAQGKHFVQRVHEGSATYAREISDKLKELVYAEVMPEIAAGFIAYRRERMGVQAETEESLREVYQASLSLLYKLLFLLYAEARGLLPVDNPGYREQSLTALAQWAADRRDRNLPLSTATHAAPRYEALLALFHRIDQGDPSLGIPRYDGGLFNPQNPDNAFLERHRLSDRAVATAVDILVRDAGQPVDYAYISVRNLGAIYEGLLENKLQVSLQPSAVSGQPPYSVLPTPYSIQLVNDKGERKATGSYYTPDYIVAYIVQQTLGPLLEARAETFAAAMGRVAEARRALGRTADPGKVRLLRPQLDTAERDAREAFLGIKVLDPAMGSGHFLVNAVDFLTDGIIRQMQAFHDAHPGIPWEWNPIQQLVERVRAEILDEMARQGIALDPARLDDTALLTRLVMKRCIYGVDLNKMAVELAKLSLWLHSFTVGAPLSFLDHHLRWGNSLIGTDVRTVEAGIQRTETGQFGLFAGPFAGLLDLTTLMVEVVDRADATLSDVQRSAGDFAALQGALTPYKQALDLWVSQHFGNAGADEFLRLYGDAVLPALRGEKQVSARHQAVITRAHELWAEKRFFHWDLEFPEVFVDLRKRDWAENPGFDAVIGNPPYSPVSSKQLRTYFGEAFQSPEYQYDTFVLFIEKGVELIKSCGYTSMIVPTTFMVEHYYSKIRAFLLSRTKISHLLHFKYPVFEDVTVESAIYVTLKIENTGDQLDEIRAAFVYEPGSISQGQLAYKTVSQDLLASLPGKDLNVHIAGPRGNVIRKMLDQLNIPFGSIAEITVGIKPYQTGKGNPKQIREDVNNRIYDATYKKDSTYQQYLVGSNIYRYDLTPNSSQWLCYGEWLAEPRQSAPFKAAKKILIRQTGDSIIAVLDMDQYLTLNNLHNVAITDKYLAYEYILAILNSSSANFFHQTNVPEEGRTFAEVKTVDLEVIPLPRITFTTPAAERARLLAEGQALAAAWVQQPDAAATPYAAFLASPFGAWLGSPVQNPKSEIKNPDVVHDLLAHLAEAMLALNKEKQAEMRGFLAWLERHIGAKLDALTGKTDLQGYLGDYQKGAAPLAFDDLLARLRQNRRKLSADPDARAFQETLEREYTASLATLLPLKQRLAATDRLIDLIVYRLYGLTEEEVRIVEGKK